MKKYCIIIHLLFSDCLWLEVKHRETVISKRVLSESVSEKTDHQLSFSSKFKIENDSLQIPAQFYLSHKNISRKEFETEYEAADELDNSFYIIGGIIPFVVIEKGMSNYFMWAAFTFLFNFPVTLADWISLPFRTGTKREKRIEKEEKILNENRLPVQNIHEYKIFINDVPVLFRRDILSVPFNAAVHGRAEWEDDQFRKYSLEVYYIRSEVRNEKGETVFSEKKRMIEFMKQSDLDAVLLASAVKKPERFKDILSYVVYRYKFNKNNEKIYKKMINAGIPLNWKNKSADYTPLNFASLHGSLELMKFLVESGADPNYTGSTGDHTSSLQYAVYSKDLEKVKYLVEMGALVNYADSFKQTALHAASGKPAIRDYLLSKGATQDAEDFRGEKPSP